MQLCEKKLIVNNSLLIHMLIEETWYVELTSARKVLCSTETELDFLTSIAVKFTFDSARLGLFSSANILQIADVALRVFFLLFLPCFQLQFLLLKRVKCPPFLVCTTKTTQPCAQVFSVNGALTCKNAAFLTSFPRLTQNFSKFGHQ